MDGGRFAGWSLRLGVERQEDGALIRIAAGKVRGEVRLSVDRSGWIVVAGEIGGAAFTGYAERIYEEIEIWPAGSAAPIADEAPGRMGKRFTWLNLSAEAWPAVAPAADGEFLLAAARE